MCIRDRNYSHPFEKAFPAENYQTLPHLPWSFGFYLSSHWTVPPLLIQFLLTPSFSLFPIGFPTAWFDWKSCVIRSCLFCWLYITICVLYCQLFCLKFLFFLFIFYLSLNLSLIHILEWWHIAVCTIVCGDAHTRSWGIPPRTYISGMG